MLKDEVPLSRPDIVEADVEAVVSVLRTDRLSIGPRIEAFEAAVAQRAQRKYGIGVSSGTSGLHLCVRSLGIGPDDEVITTPFSFIATTNAILFERATPVFVDIDPETYNMDPAAIEEAITPRTKALLPVEVFGNTAHFDTYEQIARKHGLMMIEDCCEALGGYLGKRPAGNFGDCGVFGFYPNKQITTGEGGMIVTDNEEVYELSRAMRNQGRIDSAMASHPILGYNYRLGEMTAALGATQMERLEPILEKRRQAAALYNEELREIEEIHLPQMAEAQRAAWFVYVIRLADSFSQKDRNEVLESLQGLGIQCRSYFCPIHLQPYIREMLGTKRGQFPKTESVAASTIALPFYTNIPPQNIRRVKEALIEALRVCRPRPAKAKAPPPKAP
jgi:perosamine synthetase